MIVILKRQLDLKTIQIQKCAREITKLERGGEENIELLLDRTKETCDFASWEASEGVMSAGGISLFCCEGPLSPEAVLVLTSK